MKRSRRKSPSSPYKGLIPYSEKDAPLFFGRDVEREVITANLLGSRLTLLYGASGVGKSSILQAGVVYHLRQLMNRNLERGDPLDLAVAVVSAWRDDPAFAVAAAVQASVEGSLGGRKLEPICSSRPLGDVLRAWTKRLEGELLIILDQFEEYLLYHTWEDEEGTFAREFPRAVNDPDLPVNFLVSIREDALAQLDRFQGRIPNLFDNYLRLRHLDRQGGREAIEGPVAEHNRRVAGESDGIRIESEVIESVLDDVAVGKVLVGEAGRGGVDGELKPANEGIETPYLQLVMSRLWDEEMRLGSRVLRLETLKERLCSAASIVRSHLDGALAALPARQQADAAGIFHYLVTPGGAKIAHSLEDLIEYTRQPAERVEAVLDKLTNQEVRIIRSLPPPPDQPEVMRYEIFHDSLVAAILDWRGRFLRKQERADAEQRLIRERAEAEERLARERAEAEEWLARERLEAERKLAQERAAEAQRQAIRWRLVGFTLLVLLAGMVWLAVISLRERKRALQERERAEAQSHSAVAGRLATRVLLRLGTQGDDVALLLGAESLKLANTFESHNSLLRALQSTSQLEAFLYGSRNPVSSVAFSPDGATLASGSDDGTISLWDVDSRLSSGEPLLGHTGGVLSVAFSPDKTTLASASEDGTVRLWDVRSRLPLGEPLSRHNDWIWSVAFSPDGRTLASGSADGTVRLWSVSSRQPLGELLSDHRGSVLSVAFSTDGMTLASAGEYGTVRLWDIATRQSLAELSSGHKGNVLSVAFRPVGTILAAGLSDGTVHLWDLKSRLKLGESIAGHTGGVLSIAFSPDGAMLGSGSTDHTVRLWNVNIFLSLAEPFSEHTGWARNMAFSPDGATLALGTTNDNLLFVDEPFSGHTGWVRSVAFSPVGNTLASGSEDGKVGLWNVSNHTFLGEVLSNYMRSVRSVAFSPDGKTLASGSEDGTIGLWDMVDGQPLGDFISGHSDWVLSVAFSPDGKTFASSSADGTVRLWDTSSRQPIGKDLASRKQSALTVAFSYDGKTLASGGEDGTVRLWDVAHLQPLDEPLAGHMGRVQSLAFNADEAILASGSEDGTVRLWDVATRQPLDELLTDQGRNVLSVAFSPEGKILAAGCGDGSVYLWDVARRQPLGEPLAGHTDWVLSVAFTPDGNTLASGSADGTVALWNVASFQPLGEPLTGHTGSVRSMAFSPDGKTLAAGSKDGIVLWDVDPVSWQARACRKANRNFSLEEWKQLIGSDVPYRRTCPDLPPGQGASYE